MVRVVSIIGAAFPDGTPIPVFTDEMPWTNYLPPTASPSRRRELEKNEILKGKYEAAIQQPKKKR
jgi:hypothetical protein